MKNKVKKSYQEGFSLIELMIVVVIVAILSYVAVANYGDNALRSKRTDARNTLLTTSASLEKCKTIYGAYNNASCSIQGGDTITSPEGLYTITVTVSSATNFSLSAAPITGESQENDACQTITLNYLGVQGGTTADCW
jgi:type IV pilus assembly protein PilE